MIIFREQNYYSDTEVKVNFSKVSERFLSPKSSRFSLTDGSALKKQGQTKPAHSQENALSKGQDTACFISMYTDPVFDTR